MISGSGPPGSILGSEARGRIRGSLPCPIQQLSGSSRQRLAARGGGSGPARHRQRGDRRRCIGRVLPDASARGPAVGLLDVHGRQPQPRGHDRRPGGDEARRHRWRDYPGGQYRHPARAGRFHEPARGRSSSPTPSTRPTGWACNSPSAPGRAGAAPAGHGSSRNNRCSTWWPARRRRTGPAHFASPAAPTAAADALLRRAARSRRNWPRSGGSSIATWPCWPSPRRRAMIAWPTSTKRPSTIARPIRRSRGSNRSFRRIAPFCRPSNASCQARSSICRESCPPTDSLYWDVPAGDWTILRFGRTRTGQSTRPAPVPGLGLETDKFDTVGPRRPFRRLRRQGCWKPSASLRIPATG